jgi:signal peptidase II
LDQATKAAVWLTMLRGDTIPLIPQVLSLTCVYNTGAAFGLFATKTNLLILVTVLLVAGIIWGYRKLPMERTLVRYGVALVIGGALGNLLDRIRLGYVVDFIDFHFWPVFNLADMAIVAGACLLMWDLLVLQKPQEE